jgi:hypothetical protein
MLTSIDKRSLFLFISILAAVTIIPILMFAYFQEQGLNRELLISGVLSATNSVVAAFLAVSGKEGTLKPMIQGVFTRILVLALLMALVIVSKLAEPIWLLSGFLFFYILHQIILMVWLKIHVKQQINQSSEHNKIR